MDVRQVLDAKRQKTVNDLRTLMRSQLAEDLASLTLPEIDAVIDLVAQTVPAGNVPGMILSGLARLPGRKPPLKVVRRDINLLFKGMEVTLDKAVYSAFFAGPAAVIWGYQNILKLAGKDPNDSFPYGIWQFYVEYALREDTARHGNETHGFDSILKQYKIELNPVDRITAWVMSAIQCIHEYDRFLENEWRERVYITALREITTEIKKNGKDEDVSESPHARLYHRWTMQRPYHRENPEMSFAEYRSSRLKDLVMEKLQELSPDKRREWADKVQKMELEQLPSYKQQMSILAYLQPEKYNESRTPISLEEAHVGVIHDGRYYLIRACMPGTARPVSADYVRSQIATLMKQPADDIPKANLRHLARIKRIELYSLRNNMNPRLVEGMNHLRYAPILINADRHDVALPLTEIRQSERGVGDHAITIFDTGETAIFDLSHIFFDGIWGAAFAEIMTNEALSWGRYLSEQPPLEAEKPGKVRPYSPYLSFEPEEKKFVEQFSTATPEASAENDKVDLKTLQALRKLFKRRSDLIKLTVNDLLLLYRAIHALTYEPNETLIEELNILKIFLPEEAIAKAAKAALEGIENSSKVNPTMLIPIDASQQVPRDRVYPLSFEVPLNELDLIQLHRQTMDALTTYGQTRGDRTEQFKAFTEKQRYYLAALAGFGTVLNKAKMIATQGESASVGTIRLLAHMPPALQRLLDRIPEKFDVLNDLIKGREVFSNVGSVARSSTLSRFTTAKDDNEKKTLGWAILSDAQDIMHISLRDFRPHVALLHAAGQHDLANRITGDYLDSYVRGLNEYIRDLRHITLARPILKPQGVQQPPQIDPLLSFQIGDFVPAKAIYYSETSCVYAGLRTDRLPVIIKITDAGTSEYAEAIVKDMQPLVGKEHPHIATLYEVRAYGELVYDVMQRIKGETLAERLYQLALDSDLMPDEEVLRIGRAVASALDFAHEQGIVHRDVKPGNVILGENGEVLVVDFGLTRDIPGQTLSTDTLHYMAPELTKSMTGATVASDLYSLGVMMYEMLTGLVPFDDPSPEKLGLLHRTGMPLPIRELNPELSAVTERLLLKSLSKKTERRFPNGKALIKTLETALRIKRPQRIPELPPLPLILQKRPDDDRMPSLLEDIVQTMGLQRSTAGSLLNSVSRSLPSLKQTAAARSKSLRFWLAAGGIFIFLVAMVILALNNPL